MAGSYFEIHIKPRVEYRFKRREPTANAIITNQRSHIPINLSRNSTVQPLYY
jgi:hypothetical protein